MSRLCLVGVGAPSFREARTHGGPGLRLGHLATALARDEHTILVAVAHNGSSGSETPASTVESTTRLAGREVSVVDAPEVAFGDGRVRKLVDAFRPDALVGVTALGASLACRLGVDVPLWADVFGDLMAEAQAKAAVQGHDAVLARFWSILAPVLHDADRFSAVSRAQADSLIGQLGLAGRLGAANSGAALVSVIPCAAEPGARDAPLGPEVRGKLVPRDAFVVGWSGSFNTWCDVETTFHGLETAMNENPALVFLATGGAVAGHDEKTHASFRVRVAASPLRDRFVLRGWVDAAEARACMRAADIGLVVEHDVYERRLGSENRVVHWMAEGVACVTTARSELGSGLVARGLAFAARPGDARSVADALLLAARDPARTREMGEACRSECVRELDYSASATPLRAWCRAPVPAGDRGRPRMVTIGSLTEPRAMVHLLEAYLDDLTLRQVAFRAVRWLWRRTKQRSASLPPAEVEGRRVCDEGRPLPEPRMSESPKVLVIGLDGVPWSLLRSWAAAGHLPVLSRLIDSGSAGGLHSTMPPTSGPAWSSFATGKNPGQTGIYDFLYRKPGSYVFPPVNAALRSGRSLWSLLNEAGKRVAVVNIPISYPVEKVDGVLISGWMTPYFAKDFTWPPELGDEINRQVGDYRIYPAETFAESRKDAFFRACDELLDLLTRTNLYLMRRQPWDLFMTVYFDTDRILHQLWHYLDPEHPWRRDPSDLAAPVLRYFQRLDADIGRLVDAAGPGVRVMIMSDHGMGRASRFVVLNNLLMRLGFIRLARDPATMMKSFAFRAGFTLRNVHQVVDRLGLAKHAEYKNVYSFDAVLKRFFLSFHNVDWSRTRAYSFGRHYGSVFLNVRGREPEGSVAPGAEYERVRDDIAAAVMSWVDPQLGRPLVSRVVRREEVYHGARFEEAPDLILLPEDPADIFYGLSDFGSNRVWDQTYRYSGMHRDEGVLVAAGPDVAHGAVPSASSIVDLAPTILHWLGCEVPSDMDGAPLAAIMSDEYNAANPVRLGGQSSGGAAPLIREYTPEEEEEIMDRLRDLGYMN